MDYLNLLNHSPVMESPPHYHPVPVVKISAHKAFLSLGFLPQDKDPEVGSMGKDFTNIQGSLSIQLNGFHHIYSHHQAPPCLRHSPAHWWSCSSPQWQPSQGAFWTPPSTHTGGRTGLYCCSIRQAEVLISYHWDPAEKTPGLRGGRLQPQNTAMKDL